MGWMKHEHHEAIVRNTRITKYQALGIQAAEEEYYYEQRRQERNKEAMKEVPIATPVTPSYRGRQKYPANPATDAARFEKACEQARAEAKKTGFDIAVFKNSEDQYLTWEVKYISEANKIEPLFVAEAGQEK